VIFLIRDDGVRAVKVSSWAAWAARKKMAPAAAKVSAAHEAFLSDLHGKLIAGMEPHAYSKTVARVRCGRELSSEEQQFNAMRGRVVKKGIQALTGVDCSELDPISVPRIQICASGGGYRAMVATLGSLIGMEETGILDCVTAMSGLSGSTWTMASWYSNGLTLTETRDRMAEQLSQEFYTHKLWPDTVKNHIKERVGFDQELGLVDVMGWHLHNHLNRDLPSKAEHWNHPRLSEQAARIANGSKPMPIYTAVTHEHKRYRWMEFTPWEIGMAQDINAYVPTWAFGRRFAQGCSTDFAVEPSLALLQATWGSAFCATVDQMFHELETNEGKEPALQRLLHTLIYDKLEMSEDRLITPAKFPNFALTAAGLGQHPWQAMKALKLMDAGVHTNLPFPPLLRPERETDLIIALDQSSAPDIYSSVSIDIIERWAKEEQLGFPDCTEALKPIPPTTERMKYSAANEKRCTIIRGDMSKGIPTLIYLPLLKNESYSVDFCPRASSLAKGGYCSTFNFKYTSPQVHQLSGLTAANLKDSLAEIAQCIKDVTQERMAFNKMKAAQPAQASSSNSH
jgi:phospholipase A2